MFIWKNTELSYLSMHPADLCVANGNQGGKVSGLWDVNNVPGNVVLLLAHESLGDF